MLDRDLLEEFKQSLMDKYSSVELVELLGIPEDELLDAFEDYVIEFQRR